MRSCPTLSTTRGKRITAKLPRTSKKHKACAPIAQRTCVVNASFYTKPTFAAANSAFSIREMPKSRKPHKRYASNPPSDDKTKAGSQSSGQIQDREIGQRNKKQRSYRDAHPTTKQTSREFPTQFPMQDA